MVRMIDVDSGWKYGFPKAIPPELTDWGDIMEWLKLYVPEENLQYPMRMWEEDDEEVHTD